MTTMLSIAGMAIVLSGCVAPIDEPEDEPEIERVEQLAPGDDCPEYMCGTNSPFIDNFGIHDLNLDGEKNENGFILESFTVNVDGDTVPAEMNVVGAEISATIASGEVLEGNALVDAEMRIRHEQPNALTPPTEYRLRITEVGRTNYWGLPPVGGEQHTATYLLEWAIYIENEKYPPYENVCVNPSAEDEGMNRFHTLVFEGDRINAAEKTITGVDVRWINLGCAGSAPAKQHLTGYTEAAMKVGMVTTRLQRQANLKMITAAYCPNNGTAFTVQGNLVEMGNKFMTIDPEVEVEARWNSAGATCLNQPRVAANETDLGNDVFPDIEAAITAVCARPPPCPATGTEQVVSGNP